MRWSIHDQTRMTRRLDSGTAVTYGATMKSPAVPWWPPAQRRHGVGTYIESGSQINATGTWRNCHGNDDKRAGESDGRPGGRSGDVNLRGSACRMRNTVA